MQPANNIAVVGAGLVGIGWAIVFARAGKSVAMHDENTALRAGLEAAIRSRLDDMHRYGLLDDVESVAARIRIAADLKDAVADADYIQESVFERADVKHAVSLAIASAMRADAVVGSSSSGIPASAFTGDVPHRNRFLVVHPVNPPHLIPLVELVAAPWTDPEIVPGMIDMLESVGQKPIVVKSEVEGFVLNRLQGALLNEAWALFAEGVASAADIDRTVSEGLGLRWSFMGPFETIDLNAPGGVQDYADRLSPLYHAMALDRRDPRPWSKTTIDRLTAERRQVLSRDDLAERSAWRDRRLMALAAHRRAEPAE